MQKVDTKKLREILLKEGAVLDAGYQPQVKISVTPAHPKSGERTVLKVIASPTNKDALTKIVWDLDGTGKVAQPSAPAVAQASMPAVSQASSQTCSAREK